MTHPEDPRQVTSPITAERIAAAIAGLQADTSNNGLIAQFGDRMADLHQAAVQAAEEHEAHVPGAAT